PLPATAPPTVFSAERAMADVAVIAREPHPVGSAANARVRDYLVARLRGLGLAPEVQRTAGVYAKGFDERRTIAGASVENVLAVLPGRDRAKPALVLMAHYDSVPGSPGAADDAAGTAAVLEIARALKAAGTPPARDVILLLTDGEESGLLGAEAFFRAHPLAARAGFVINLEARGGSGRASMFETGPRNGRTVDLLAGASTQPASNSLAVFVYQRLPNDTDFSVPKAKAIAGLNYAFIDTQFDYHSPTSTPANLDQGSLQHMGQEALGAARAVAFAEALPAAAPDKVYDSLLGLKIVSYPPAFGWLIVLSAAALVVAATLGARRAGRLTWLDVAQGVGAGLYLLGLAVTLQHLVGRFATGGRMMLDGFGVLARFGLFEAGVMAMALAALLFTAALLAPGRRRLVMAALPLAAGLAGSAVVGFDLFGAVAGAATAGLALLVFGRPLGRAGAGAGILLTGILVGAAAQATAPLAAFVLTWPLLVGAILAFATALGERGGAWRWALTLALTAFAVGWLLQLAHTLLVGMGQAEGPALILWLAAFSLWPLAPQGRAGQALGAAALLVGVAIAVTLRVSEPWTDRYPKAEFALFHQDAATGRAWRVSTGGEGWSRQVLGGEGERHRIEPDLRLAGRAAPAPAIAQPPPQVSLARLPDGRLQLTARPAPGADNVSLQLKATVPVDGFVAGGVPVAGRVAAGRTLNLRWEAAPDGVALEFRPAGPGAVEVAMGSVLPGWPATAAPLPPLPARTMGFYTSGSTLVTDKRRLSF
ncbi:MAG: M20/M25/M40 family metallo-hydrolase, partial [Caulobacteraceae bacterium]|nr:M20/M25/M40 family metallo-hydrolase [Caulobacteraceae bacterium]